MIIIIIIYHTNECIEQNARVKKFEMETIIT